MFSEDQLETLGRDLLAIARCARQLHADIEPKRAAVGDDGVWHRPVYGPRDPVDLAALSLLDEVGRLLGWYLHRIAVDFLGAVVPGADQQPGPWAAGRDKTTHAKANRLYEQRHYIADREWAPEMYTDVAHVRELLCGVVEPVAPPASAVPTEVLDKRVSATEAARVLRIPVGTIYRWGSEGRIPKYVGDDGQTVYRLGDLYDHRR